MLPNNLMILGDWGTSVCRLYLCRFHQQKLRVIARTKGLGVKHINDPEARFFEMAKPWFEQHGTMPVFLIGSVGADIGWCHVPHVPCSADKNTILAAAFSFSARDIEFTILPGLSCVNRHGLPDIMRGEETQLFGLMASQDKIQQEQLVCLPGTHTKWALLREQNIHSFVTSPVGEMFEVLCHHSILLNPEINQTWSTTSFTEGLQVGMRESSSLLHTIFATRASQILDKKNNSQAAGFLSGLLIGADVKAAMQDFDVFSHVVVIGSSHICSLYVEALEYIGISSQHLSCEDAILMGLQSLASAHWGQHAAH